MTVNLDEKYFEGTLVSNVPLAGQIYDMVISVPEMVRSNGASGRKSAPEMVRNDASAGEAAGPGAGQFVGLYVGGGHLLPRPISICEVRPENGTLRLVYRTAGKGTECISHWQPGDKVKLLGPLGNGFKPVGDRKVYIVVGGGVGIPPMLELAKRLVGQGSKVAAVLGFADETFLVEDFKKYAGEVYVATDSGREGVKGNVTDILNSLSGARDAGADDNTGAAGIAGAGNTTGAASFTGTGNITGAAMYACGPKPMLKAVSEFAAARGIPLQVSMEERMACGIGSCLCCAVQGKKDAPNGRDALAAGRHDGDGGRTVYLRVCKDGPVFDSREVLL